jgi:4-amino-4-deoxychorismate lyase
MQHYFETIKCENFKIFNLEYHKKRVANTISRNFVLEEYIYPPTKNLLKCKVIYTKDEIVDVIYDDYIAKDIYKFKIIKNNDIVYDKKSINRDMINKLFDKRETANEIIIIKNGIVTDTSIANIAIYQDNQWITTKNPLLYGTTRERYINSGFLKEKDIDIDMLKNSKKIALLNVMIDFQIISDFILI